MNRARKIALGALVAILVAQFVRPAITNPPVVAEPHWDNKQTRDLVHRACFDCHSNETVAPWYSQIAPFRWLIAHHVSEARENLNFSDPASEYDLEAMVKEIRDGEMPTWDYRLVHPSARLTDSERDSLVAGLKATFAAKSENGDSVAQTQDSRGEKEREGREVEGGKSSD
jgi:hypothetical protein